MTQYKNNQVKTTDSDQASFKDPGGGPAGTHPGGSGVHPRGGGRGVPGDPKK